MRSTVIAVFFLAMVPLGVLAAELGTTGHRSSSVQNTTGEETKHVSTIYVVRETEWVFASDFAFPPFAFIVIILMASYFCR